MDNSLLIALVVLLLITAGLLVAYFVNRRAESRTKRVFGFLAIVASAATVVAAIAEIVLIATE